MVRTGNYHHIETFVVADQRVSESHRAGRMHIVVNLPGNQQQPALKIGGEFGCCGNLAFECLTAVFPDDFLYTVEGFSPPLGVDIIVVIARCPHCHLVELGMAEQCSGCHKTSTRMSVNPHSVKVCARIFFCNLPYYGYVIVYGIVAQVAVAVGVVVAAPRRAGTSVRKVKDYESQFCKHLISIVIVHKVQRHLVVLRPRIDIADYGIFAPGVQVRRQVHHSV